MLPVFGNTSNSSFPIITVCGKAMGKIFRDWRGFNYTILCSKYCCWLHEAALERPEEFKVKGSPSRAVKPRFKTDFFYRKKCI